jgi:hypothetical protein
MSSCKICGEKISRWPFYRAEKHPHYRTIHPDYVIWHKHYLKKVFVIGLIVVGIISVASFFSLKLYGFISPYPYILLFLYALAANLQIVWNLRRFKREWKKAHPSMTQANHPE